MVRCIFWTPALCILIRNIFHLFMAGRFFFRATMFLLLF